VAEEAGGNRSLFEDQKIQAAELARLKRDITRLSEENAFLKKAGSVLRERTEVKYAVINANKALFGMKMMCRVLSVSRSGYYAWKKQPESLRSQETTKLAKAIRAIYDDEKQRVGSPRITKRLRASGYAVGRNRVACIMRQEGWRAKGAKKIKATTNSRHNLPVAPICFSRILKQFDQTKICVRYNLHWTDEGWLYLAVVLDLYSRYVVGWAMSERMTATLVCDALQMALWRRKRPTGVIVHSDRGVQYCSHEYQVISY